VARKAVNRQHRCLAWRCTDSDNHLMYGVFADVLVDVVIPSASVSSCYSEHANLASWDHEIAVSLMDMSA